MLKNFDKIICLSSDKRIAQWGRLRGQFDERGVEVETFLTGDGYLAPIEAYSLLNDPFLPNNAARCYEGHRAILEKCKREQYRNVLLLEDDVLLLPGFDELLEKCAADLVRNANEGWDLWYLGMNHTWGVTEEITPNLLRIRGKSYCCHAMAINIMNKPMYDILLDLPFRPDIGPLDYWISERILPDPQYKAYAMWPNLCVQEEGLSILNGCQMSYNDYFKNKGTPYGH